MNKNEFVKKLSMELNIPIRFCKMVLNKQFEIIKRELNTGGIINFKSVGKVFVDIKKERFIKINNKEYLIPQKNEPKVKLFRGFKNIVK